MVAEGEIFVEKKRACMDIRRSQEIERMLENEQNILVQERNI